jgi:hypothetical protein
LVGIDEASCREAIDYLLDMQQKSFIDFWSVISKNQRKLLRGLALYSEKGHSSAAFIKKSGLSSSSASSKALEVNGTDTVLFLAAMFGKNRT